eukprot:gene4633-3321_t
MPPKVKPISVALAGETISLVEEKPTAKARPRKPTKARLTKLETDILSLPPEEQEEVLQRIANQRALLALAQQKGKTPDGGQHTALEELELDQLRYELGDVLQRQVELRLKEKKVKALIVKKQRQIILAYQNASFTSAVGHSDDDDTHGVTVPADDAVPFPASAIATSSHRPVSGGSHRATSSSLWNLSQHIDLESTKLQRVDIRRDCILVSAEDINEVEDRCHAPRAIVDVDVDGDESKATALSEADNAAQPAEVTLAVDEAEVYSHWRRWVQQLLAQLATERDGGATTTDVDASPPPATTHLSWPETHQILQRLVAEEGATVDVHGGGELRTQWCCAQTSLTADVAAMFERLDDVKPSESASPARYPAWQRVRQAAMELWLHQYLRWHVASLTSLRRDAGANDAPSDRPVASETTAAVDAEQRAPETNHSAAIAAAADDRSTLPPSPPVINLFSDDVRSDSEPPRKRLALGSRPRPPLPPSDDSSNRATAAAACVIDLASPALQRTAVAKGPTNAATDTSAAAMASSPTHSSTIRTTPLFERLKKISGRQLRRPPTIPEVPVQSSSWELPMVLDDADDGDVEPPPPIAVATTATATATVTVTESTAATAAAAAAALSSTQRLDRLCQDYGLTALRQQPSLLRHVVARLVPPSGGAASAVAPDDAVSASERGVHPSGGAALSSAAVTETAPFEERSLRTVASFLQHPTQQTLLQRIVTFDVIDVDDVVTAARVFWYQHRPLPSTAAAAPDAASAAAATAGGTLPDDWLQFFSVDVVRQALDAMHVFYKVGAANAKRSDGQRKRKAKGKSATSAV